MLTVAAACPSVSSKLKGFLCLTPGGRASGNFSLGKTAVQRAGLPNYSSEQDGKQNSEQANTRERELQAGPGTNSSRAGWRAANIQQAQCQPSGTPSLS